MRINKALALAGYCSRRAADELIAKGLVTVNGRTAGPGDRVDPAKDRIEVQGKALGSPAGEHAYVLLNKPVRVVTTAKDPQGRKTVLDILPAGLKRQRVYPVGRLDFFSEGLLILTSDGELANRLMHPSHHLPKVYRLHVRGEVAEDALDAMHRGMTLAEGERLAPVDVRVLRRAGDTATLELTLVQGVNRQIRRMCRDLGLTVLRLARTSQGPLTLSGLKPGQARALTPDEVRELKKAVGLS
ncbi:pseudouridine synthase [Desulfocurvus sp. DL9XJH121]